VILPAHDLRRHVARRARGIRSIISFQNSGNALVSYSQVAILLHNDVLWLDVPMNHILVVHVFEADDHACNHKFSLLFVEPALFANVVA